MLISGTILKKCVEKYQRHRRRHEKFTSSNAIKTGFDASYISFTLLIAILFFLMELLMLIYAIGISVSCTKGGPERLVNVIMALTFTTPYVMLNVLFNKCAKSSLRGETEWLPSSPI